MTTADNDAVSSNNIVSDLIIDNKVTLRFKTIQQIVNNNYKGIQKLPDDIIYDVIMYSHWCLFSDCSVIDDTERCLYQWPKLMSSRGYHPIKHIEYKHITELSNWIYPHIKHHMINNNKFGIVDLYWAHSTNNDSAIEEMINHQRSYSVLHLLDLTDPLNTRLATLKLKYIMMFAIHCINKPSRAFGGAPLELDLKHTWIDRLTQFFGEDIILTTILKTEELWL